MSSSSLLSVRGLDVRWEDRPVLSSLDLDVAERELLVLLGPNGSGKTTLLRTLVGLETPTTGRIVLQGRPIDDLPTHRRGIGLLAQEAALFPRRTVFENIAYGLEVARAPTATVDARVDELVALLGLRGLEDRSPTALSGGERQRVALARTLAPAPSIVLLDEPFSSIDPERRGELIGDFRRALRATSTAAIHVTHDREEGLFLGDRVAILLEGRIAQAGTPAELYRAPVSSPVAAFLGYNLFPAGRGQVAVDPRECRIVRAGTGRVDADVLSSGFTGVDRRYILSLDSGARIEVRMRESETTSPRDGRVGVDWSGGRQYDH